MNKGKYLVAFLASAAFLIFQPHVAFASTLECSDVDGMSIFGWDTWDDEYKFIGAISNEYDSDSIANEYGAGNEYSSDSIFNDYGDFGGKYSSESAFNDYASKPPVIINDNFEFVGYLTTNSYTTPSIDTYNAIACAKKSYASSNSDHEDFTFSKLPSIPSYGGGYSQEDVKILLELLKQRQQMQCPTNATNIDGSCFCNTGYKAGLDKNSCVPAISNQQQSPTYQQQPSSTCAPGETYSPTGIKKKCIPFENRPSNVKPQADGSCKLGSQQNVKGYCVPAIGASTNKKPKLYTGKNDKPSELTQTGNKKRISRTESTQERAKARSKKRATR